MNNLGKLLQQNGGSCNCFDSAKLHKILDLWAVAKRNFTAKMVNWWRIRDGSFPLNVNKCDKSGGKEPSPIRH